jgi:flagellar motor switch protein FliN
MTQTQTYPADAENSVATMLSPTGGLLPSSIRAFHLPEFIIEPEEKKESIQEATAVAAATCDASAVADFAAQASPGESLDVRIDLGHARLPSNDAALLRNGAVVSLDAGVEEPVDICIAGKVIGRGNVLVVDGKIGVRVVELFSKETAS